jgi:hypothetical protein
VPSSSAPNASWKHFDLVAATPCAIAKAAAGFVLLKAFTLAAKAAAPAIDAGEQPAMAKALFDNPMLEATNIPVNKPALKTIFKVLNILIAFQTQPLNL